MNISLETGGVRIPATDALGAMPGMRAPVACGAVTAHLVENAPPIPRYRRVGGRWEHREVFVREYGPIPTGWECHHLSGDRHDNRPENLSGMPVTLHRHYTKQGRLPWGAPPEAGLFGVDWGVEYGGRYGEGGRRVPKGSSPPRPPRCHYPTTTKRAHEALHEGGQVAAMLHVLDPSTSPHTYRTERFPCLIHEGQRAWIAPNDRGAWLYHYFRKSDGELAVITIAEMCARRFGDREDHGLAGHAVTAGTLLTLVCAKAGLIHIPKRPLLPPLPESASALDCRVYHAVDALFHCRWATYVNCPIPLARRFLVLWLAAVEGTQERVPSDKTIERAIQRFGQWGLIDRVAWGRKGGRTTWFFMPRGTQVHWDWTPARAVEGGEYEEAGWASDETTEYAEPTTRASPVAEPISVTARAALRTIATEIADGAWERNADDEGFLDRYLPTEAAAREDTALHAAILSVLSEDAARFPLPLAAYRSSRRAVRAVRLD